MHSVITPLQVPPGDLLALSDAEVCAFLETSFDSSYYMDRYADMRMGHSVPLEHYTVFGWKEGRDPCAWFSTERYLKHHVDVAQTGINPLLHYLVYGEREGRQIWGAEISGSVNLEVDRTATLVNDPNLRDLIQIAPRALSRPRTKLRANRLILHWLIPDFSPGSGGHMTIFRIIRWLEFMGHECTIWIALPEQHVTASDAYDDICRKFQTIRARVAFVDEGFDTAKGDVVIATGWQTVARVLASAHFRERCYFVQDNEAKFHPMGSSALIANWTYKQELACICAGPWLARTLKKQFGRWTRYFNLAFDQDSYYPPESVGGPGVARSPLRIALYARNGTARRAVELAFLALEHMAADGIKFHVDLFGEDNVYTRAPFPCTIHGILNASELAELYRNDDLGMCFSTTNYSLVPQEMMACGLPVVEIDGDSTRAVYPEGVITFTGPHPRVIAADVAALLEDEPRRRQQSADALSWSIADKTKAIVVIAHEGDRLHTDP